MSRLDLLLKDWEDFDVAIYYMACLLGIAKYDSSFHEFQRTKGLYWSGNAVSDPLHDCLKGLVQAGVLLSNDDSQYRWNDNFSDYRLNPDIETTE